MITASFGIRAGEIRERGAIRKSDLVSSGRAIGIAGGASRLLNWNSRKRTAQIRDADETFPVAALSSLVNKSPIAAEKACIVSPWTVERTGIHVAHVYDAHTYAVAH